MFWVLYKILLRVAISSGYVYCLIFDSVVVRVVDYLEFVSELLLLNSRCAIFLLYQGVKLCKNYISMIWQCYSIYSRPTLFDRFVQCQLTKQSIGEHVAHLGHIIFIPGRPLEKQHILIFRTTFYSKRDDFNIPIVNF